MHQTARRDIARNEWGVSGENSFCAPIGCVLVDSFVDVVVSTRLQEVASTVDGSGTVRSRYDRRLVGEWSVGGRNTLMRTSIQRR